MKLSIALVLVLAGCTYDLSLGNQSVGHDGGPADARSDAERALPPLPAGVSSLPHGACRILVDAPDILVACGPELRRIRPDASSTVLLTIGNGMIDVHAQDATKIYLVHRYDKIVTPGGGSYWRYGILAFDKQTGAVETMTDDWDEILSVTIDTNAIYFATGVPPIPGDPYDPRGQLVRVDKQTFQTHLIYEALDQPLGLAVDDRYVYVANDAGHNVVAVAKSGGRAFDVAQNVNRPSSVLAHGNYLYFTERGNTLTDGKISRVARPTTSTTPGVVETIAAGLAHPTDIAIDGEEIFATSYFLGLYRAGMTPGVRARLVFDTRVQGNNRLAGGDHRIYFAARYPDNTGSVIYVVDTTALE